MSKALKLSRSIFLPLLLLIPFFGAAQKGAKSTDKYVLANVSQKDMVDAEFKKVVIVYAEDMEDTPKVSSVKSPSTSESKNQKIIKDNHGKIIKEGSFINGELYTGKHYFYSLTGELERTEFYRNGKYVGNQL